MIDYKKDTYHKDRHPEFLKSDLVSKAWSEFAYLEYFKDLNSKDVILEFGGGLGNNLFHIAKTNDVFMVEPSDLGRSNAEKFGIKTSSDINELLAITKRKYDIILCRHVLEHVLNPLETLKQLKSLLTPDGELILILPFEKEIKPVKEEIDFHLYCWTPRTAMNLLKTANFQKSSWKYNYFTGKRILLPIYKYFGLKAYYRMMKILGRISNAKELLIRCN